MAESETTAAITCWNLLSLLSNLLEALFFTWQATLQSIWKPACWLDFCRNFHSEEEAWNCDCSCAEAIDIVWEAADSLPGYVPRSSLLVDGKHVIVIDFFTRAKWMDQIVVQFDAFEQATSAKCSATVVTESTGFLPLCIPFACLINLVFFWFPFLDGDGKCGHTMEMLKREMERRSGKHIQSQTTRYSKSNRHRSQKSKKHR